MTKEEIIQKIKKQPVICNSVIRRICYDAGLDRELTLELLNDLKPLTFIFKT